MMFFKALSVAFLAATSLAAKHEHPRRQEAASTTGIDYNHVSTMLDQYMSTMTMEPMIPSQTQTLGISVPSSLKQQIMTAVPMKVIIELMNPEKRESVASDFAEGRTPEWYESLDPELKTYFEGMASSIHSGDAVFTVTPTPTADPDSPEGDAGSGDVEETETSDGLARPTGVDNTVMAGAVGMFGVLGVALAL